MTTESGSIPLHSSRSEQSLQDPPLQDSPPPKSVKEKWSRRIVITTEPLWIARIRRHKLRTFLLIFFPGVFIFLLAFFFAPPAAHSTHNNLMFYLGGVWKPNMQFTAGILPKRFHSSNDFRQYVPLMSALSYGASSIEVALYEQNGQLLVGDDAKHISTDRSLSSLYLQPLQSLIDEANLLNKGDTPRGVFATAPFLSLQILMNIYSDGHSGYELLLTALKPFRDAGYLTTYNSSNSTSRMEYSILTIIGAGNTPVADIQANADPIRYIFYDAPLADINSPSVNYTTTLSPIASASWASTIGARWIVPSLAEKKIAGYVQGAHSRGIQTRFWGTPSIPQWARNKIWQMMLDAGSDWLDVDDLCDASNF